MFSEFTHSEKMRAKTLELLAFIRESQAKEKPTVEHLRALVEDISAVGGKKFIAEAELVLSKSPKPAKKERGSASGDRLSQKLTDYQTSTELQMNAFLDDLVSKIAAKYPNLAKPRKGRSLSVFLKHYRESLSDDQILQAAQETAKQYSWTH